MADLKESGSAKARNSSKKKLKGSFSKNKLGALSIKAEAFRNHNEMKRSCLETFSTEIMQTLTGSAKHAQLLPKDTLLSPSHAKNQGDHQALHNSGKLRTRKNVLSADAADGKDVFAKLARLNKAASKAADAPTKQILLKHESLKKKRTSSQDMSSLTKKIPAAALFKPPDSTPVMKRKKAERSRGPSNDVHPLSQSIRNKGIGQVSQKTLNMALFLKKITEKDLKSLPEGEYPQLSDDQYSKFLNLVALIFDARQSLKTSDVEPAKIADYFQIANDRPMFELFEAWAGCNPDRGRASMLSMFKIERFLMGFLFWTQKIEETHIKSQVRDLLEFSLGDIAKSYLTILDLFKYRNGKKQLQELRKEIEMAIRKDLAVVKIVGLSSLPDPNAELLKNLNFL